MTQTKAELLETKHQGDIRLGDANSSHYVGFKAPATVGSNQVWTLPAADGTANYLLKTDGSGNLGWVADSSTDSTKMPLAGGTFTGDVNFADTAQLEITTSSTSAYALRLTDAGVANYDFVFPDTATLKITTNTGSTKQLELRNAGSGYFDFLLADNGKVKLGDSNDLQLFHDGGNSWLKEAGTGALYIDTDGSLIALSKGGASETMAKFYTDGAVELYHNNSKKIETTSTGAVITGTCAANSGFVSDTNLIFNCDNNANNGANDSIRFQTAGTERVRINGSGKVGIGTTSPEGLLHLEVSSSGASYTADAADTFILERNGGCVIDFRTPSANDAGLIFSDNDSRASGTVLYNHSDNHIQVGTAGSERFRVASAGQLGIGGANYGTSGQVLTSGGASAAPAWADAAGGGFSNIVRITSTNSSWSIPAGATTIKVYVVGGGGGGGGNPGRYSGSGGGGGGGEAIRYYDASGGGTANVTIGAGGSSSSSSTGGSGGASSFVYNSVTTSASGGSGGYRSAAYNSQETEGVGGNGGYGTAGTIFIQGLPGGRGNVMSGVNKIFSGFGGGTRWGGGPRSESTHTGTSGTAGRANTGAGGSGAAQDNIASGTGGSGVVIVEY